MYIYLHTKARRILALNYKTSYTNTIVPAVGYFNYDKRNLWISMLFFIEHVLAFFCINVFSFCQLGRFIPKTLKLQFPLSFFIYLRTSQSLLATELTLITKLQQLFFVCVFGKCSIRFIWLNGLSIEVQAICCTEGCMTDSYFSIQTQDC